MFRFVGIIRCAVMVAGHRHHGRIVMANRKTCPANNTLDQVRRPATEDFVWSRFRDQIDVVHVSIQLHPIRDWLLHAAIDAGNRGGKFVSRHVLMILSDSGQRFMSGVSSGATVRLKRTAQSITGSWMKSETFDLLLITQRINRILPRGPQRWVEGADRAANQADHQRDRDPFRLDVNHQRG